MRSKRFLQFFVSLVMLFSLVGGAQPVSASNGPAPDLDAVVIDRDLDYWNATYYGFVSSGIYENWRFEFTASHEFTVTVTRVSGDLVPLIILKDASENELARGAGSLTSTQPAGSYSFQIQPESGMGLYMLTLREVAPPSQPSSSTVVAPTNINVGETAVVTVNLNDFPAEGYTSAEFTCTYNASLVELGNISVTELFGTDPVMAVTTPQDGSFIVAIAGSNGKKATSSGAAFTFRVLGLQAGQTTIGCVARVSKGDGVLTKLDSVPDDLNILFLGDTPTPTFTPTLVESPTPVETLTPTFTATPVESPTPVESLTPTATPVESSTPTATQTPVESATPTITETPTFTATPVESPTPTFTPTTLPSPTATPQTTGGFTGYVQAGKPVTVSLYDAEHTLVAWANVNPDGSFGISTLAGTYTAVATAEGFLSAESSVTITAAEVITKPEITLLAGDIDNNNVINEFDALTIGMNYNTNTPAAADLNNDGTINVLDLELLARNYRATGPLTW